MKGAHMMLSTHIQSIAGVYLAEERGDFDKVTYTTDICSSDLYPVFSGN